MLVKVCNHVSSDVGSNVISRALSVAVVLTMQGVIDITRPNIKIDCLMNKVLIVT